MPRLFRPPMLFLARYAELLDDRDLRRTVTASVIGRLPIGVTGLSILLLAQGGTGSFAQGGIMAAAYVVGLACVAPWIGRVIDRSGPRSVLRICAIAFPAALIALVLAIELQAPRPLAWLFAFAAGAGFPPITVCMRTLFRQRLGDNPLLSAAYSLESVLIEVIFIVGPILVAVLIAVASRPIPVLFAAACGTAGTWLFLRSPALLRWHIDARTPTGLLGPLAAPKFLLLLSIICGYAGAFGLIEIGVAGYASSIGYPALTGVLLSLMSVGSALGGLAYGSRSWRPPLPRQFALTLALIGVGVGSLAVAANPWLFAGLGFVAGLVMAPALTIQSMLVAKIAIQAHSAEAFTWSSTGLLSGVGLGMAAGGWIIERWGWNWTFGLACMAALGASIAALALRLRD